MARLRSAYRLRDLEVFRGCTDKEIARVAALADEMPVRSGRVIVQEHGLTKEFYILVSGEAVVSRGAEPIGMVHAGGYFGELAVLDPAPRSATVTMVTDGVLLVLGQREFATLLDDIPKLSRQLLSRLAQRVHELDRV